MSRTDCSSYGRRHRHRRQHHCWMNLRQRRWHQQQHHHRRWHQIFRQQKSQDLGPVFLIFSLCCGSGALSAPIKVGPPGPEMLCSIFKSNVYSFLSKYCHLGWDPSPQSKAPTKHMRLEPKRKGLDHLPKTRPKSKKCLSFYEQLKNWIADEKTEWLRTIENSKHEWRLKEKSIAEANSALNLNWFFRDLKKCRLKYAFVDSS